MSVPDTGDGGRGGVRGAVLYKAVAERVNIDADVDSLVLALSLTQYWAGQALNVAQARPQGLPGHGGAGASGDAGAAAASVAGAATASGGAGGAAAASADEGSTLAASLGVGAAGQDVGHAAATAATTAATAAAAVAEGVGTDVTRPGPEGILGVPADPRAALHELLGEQPDTPPPRPQPMVIVEGHLIGLVIQVGARRGWGGRGWVPRLKVLEGFRV